MKVLFRFDASEALKKRISARSGDGIEIVSCAEAEDSAYDRLLPGIDVLWHVLKPVTAEAIARAPKLRLIQKIGSGVNTIDVEAAKHRGIAVCNLPGTNSRAVAEMALLLMLACLRRLPELRGPEGWRRQADFGRVRGRRLVSGGQRRV